MSADVLARGLSAQARVAAGRQALKASGLRLATFGHSFSAYGFTSSATSSAILDRSSAGWAAVLSGQRLTIDPAGNFGVTGQTIAQVLARVPAVLAYDADVIELWAGANDIWPYPQSVATMQAGYAAILDQLTAAGKLVLAMPIVPRVANSAGFAGASAAQILDAQQRTEQFNRWLFDTVSRRRDVFVVDVLDLWTDLALPTTVQAPGGTSANSGSYTIDGLHPSALGAFVLGLRVGDLINRALPSRPRSWQPFTGTFDLSLNPRGNLLANPLMAGTANGFAGTGVTGSVVNSWAAARYSGANITATASKATKTLANGLGAAMQQLALSNGGSGAQSVIFYQQVAASGKYTPGSSVLRGSIDVEVDAGAQIVGLRAGLLEYNSASTQIFQATAPTPGDTSATGAVLPSIAWSGRFRSPPLTTLATDDHVWLAVEVFVPAGGVATVRLGNAFLAVEG